MAKNRKNLLYIEKENEAKDFIKEAVKKVLDAECIEEFVFDTERKFRFDLFIPEYNLAIEVNGCEWTKGKHTYGTQYAQDLTKINIAQLKGYIVIQLTYSTIFDVYEYLNTIKSP